MSKIVLNNLTTNFGSQTLHNANNDTIEDHLNNKVLYRDNPTGEANQMENQLDMNSYKITNLASASNAGDAVNYGQLVTALGPDSVSAAQLRADLLSSAGGTHVGSGIVTLAVELSSKPLSAMGAGIVPNDVTKRAANTAALLAAWNTEGIRGVMFPPTDDIWYFDYFVIPNKVVFLKGHTTLRGNSGAILDITEDPTTNVAIDTIIGAPQFSRFSRLENLILTVPLTATACRVRNGGLMIKDFWVTQSNIGLWVLESYGANYHNIGCSAVTAALRLCDGVNGGFVASNDFIQLVLNNYVTGASEPALTGKGLWIDASGASGIGGAYVNSFQNMDCSSCGWGTYITGTSRGNVFGPYYAENNRQKNIEYVAPTGVLVQDDHWEGFYYGGGTYTPTADVFPAYTGEMGVTRIDGGNMTVKTVITPRVLFTNDYEFGNPQALDWYEEGTFTPVINRGAGALVTTYTTQVGTFVRIGKQITAYLKIVIGTISSPSSDVNILQGLPYTSGAAGDQTYGNVGRDSALSSACKGGYLVGSNIHLINTSGTDINEAWVNGGTIEMSITYFAAS